MRPIFCGVFTSPELTLSSTSATVKTLSVAFNGKACIKYEPLLDILKDNASSEPSKCRINNQQNMAQQMLKTTQNEMPDINSVLKMLHKLKVFELRALLVFTGDTHSKR